MGAFLNVKINAAGLEDKTLVSDYIKGGEELVEKANLLEKEILDMVNGKIVI